ncbi:hypothetical protein GCM10027425_12340 [Alteromonas gracilis]
MPDSLADLTYKSALMMWEGNGSRGKRPAREDFDHLAGVTGPRPTATPESDTA